MPENTHSEDPNKLSEREIREARADKACDEAFMSIREAYPSLPDPFAAIAITLYEKTSQAIERIKSTGAVFFQEQNKVVVYPQGVSTQEQQDAVANYRDAGNEYNSFRQCIENTGMEYDVVMMDNGDFVVVRNKEQLEEMTPLEQLIALHSLYAISFYWQDILIDYDQRAKEDPKTLPLIADKML